MTDVLKLSFRRLVWAIPAAYAVHICEEYFAGFPDWVVQFLSGAMTRPFFLAANAVLMAVLLALTVQVGRGRTGLPVFALLALSSAQMGWNFVFHLATTALYGRYSPGLVSAAALYYPLSLLIWRAAWRERLVGRAAFFATVAVGPALLLLAVWTGLFRFRM